MNIKVFDVMKDGVKQIGIGYKKNKPLVLIIISGAASLWALKEMYTEGPKIKKGLDEAKKEFKNAETTKEKAVAVVNCVADIGVSIAKVAVPEAISIVAGAESYKESSKRILAFAGMAATSQLELKDFKEATKEVVGKKKVDTIEEKVAEKQFDRMQGDELTDFNDSDFNIPDIFKEDVGGCVWRGKYINTLDAISAFYTHAKTGNEIFYPISELYDLIDQYKDGNYIRRGSLCEEWGVMQSDLKDIDNAQDMLKMVDAGHNRYKLVWQIKLRPNPDGWIDAEGKYLDGKGVDMYDTSFDDICGDGEWNNGSLNPKERA